MTNSAPSRYSAAMPGTSRAVTLPMRVMPPMTTTPPRIA